MNFYSLALLVGSAMAAATDRFQRLRDIQEVDRHFNQKPKHNSIPYRPTTLPMKSTNQEAIIYLGLIVIFATILITLMCVLIANCLKSRQAKKSEIKTQDYQ